MPFKRNTKKTLQTLRSGDLGGQWCNAESLVPERPIHLWGSLALKTFSHEDSIVVGHHPAVRLSEAIWICFQLREEIAIKHNEICYSHNVISITVYLVRKGTIHFIPWDCTEILSFGKTRLWCKILCGCLVPHILKMRQLNARTSSF